MGRENKPGEPAADDQEGFLARWSRRKLDVQVDAVDMPENESAAATPPEPPAAAAETVLTDADMPPIETLDGNSDFSPFLSPGVSDGLRRQALRKLFSQPAYNITDGLNDYDEDFTQFASLGNLVTREMKRRMQRELEAEKRRNESGNVQTGETGAAGLPADDMTAAAETGNTDREETTTQNNETDKGDVPSG